ncbi:MAG: tRNA pseudouridine(13) synthase TruD [Spirochaetes bacterium]|nr:tRNA pseudouridine(13) synthase TruD [Spirochaetota bacterium]
MKIKCKNEDFIVNEILDINNIEKIKFIINDNKVYINNNNKTDYNNYFFIIIKNKKSYIEHFELINEISELFKIKEHQIYFCGIKDKYSNSTQIFSIKTNLEELNKNNYLVDFIKKREIVLPKLKLSFLCLSKENIGNENLIKNNFSIVVRDIIENQKECIQKNIEEIILYGLPNYFDEQRFGSFKKINGIPGKYFFQRNYEKFLVTFLEPYENEKKELKEIKHFILNNWREWNQILNKLEIFLEQIKKEYYKNKRNKNILKKILDEAKFLYRIISYIKSFNSSPSFFKCTKFISKNLIILLLNSYQSILFNSLLNNFLYFLNINYDLTIQKYEKLNKLTSLNFLTNLNANFFYFYKFKNNNYSYEFFNILKNLKLPLIGYDVNEKLKTHKIELEKLIDNYSFTDDNKYFLVDFISKSFNFIENNVNQLLKKEKLELSKMKVKSKLNMDIATKMRNIIVFPENLTYKFENDEIYKNKLKLILNFNLPKGSYATILIKRIF